MAFTIDAGGSGGSEGPWLVWSARGTQDGGIPARRFYVRDKNGGKADVTEMMQRGAVFDFDTLKTGWQEDTGGQKGVAPKWVFGSSPLRLPEAPGDNYKKGFSVRVALAGGQVASWDQSGAGVFIAIVDVAKTLEIPPGHCPIIRLANVRVEEFGKGKTAVPILEAIKYIPRPASLKQSVAMDSGFEAPPPVSKPAPQMAVADPDDFG